MPENNKQPSTPEIRTVMQFFEFSHLPVNLQYISSPFYDLAQSIHETLPNNEQKIMALHKLLEAKDCAVRAVVAR